MQLRRDPDIELAFVFFIGCFSEFTAHFKIIIDGLMKHGFKFLYGRTMKGKRVIDPKYFPDEEIILIRIPNCRMISFIFYVFRLFPENMRCGQFFSERNQMLDDAICRGRTGFSHLLCLSQNQ